MENKPIVLVVDDDPALLKMAGEILKDSYAVSFAKSGVQMVELVKGGLMPDMILLDVDMPEQNGFDALLTLRELEDAQEIPVVFLTGIDQPEAELKGLSSGAVDYITKPFVREILLARLNVHLENGRRLRQLSIMEKSERGKQLDEEKFWRLSVDLNETERKILRLIALGYTNQEISEALSYSYNYVKKVVNIIYEKKLVNKRSELKKLLM